MDKIQEFMRKTSVYYLSLFLNLSGFSGGLVWLQQTSQLTPSPDYESFLGRSVIFSLNLLLLEGWNEAKNPPKMRQQRRGVVHASIPSWFLDLTALCGRVITTNTTFRVTNMDVPNHHLCDELSSHTKFCKFLYFY